MEDLAERRHRFYRGKLGLTLKAPITSYEDLAVWYTPGVAQPCKAILAKREKVYEYTNKGNSVAVITDGSRILGLGNIGPEAGLPVMEGKAMLFKYLGDVDAFPICLGIQDPEKIIDAVKWVAPTFGGISLEDIDAPQCFYIYERLSREMEIPVFHDDQQGTSVVTLAGVVNALKVVGKKLKQVQFANIGAGAAGLAVAKLLIDAGANPGKIILVDKHGTLYRGRGSMDGWKEELAQVTNKEGRIGGISEAVKEADVLIGLSKPELITKDMVGTMAENPIVFALANPYPEIYPQEALEGGARVVATGRSDLPNQVNNALGFPAIFRGVLDARVRMVNTEILLAAAYEIAEYAEEKGLSENRIMPTLMDIEVYAREAAAVVRAALATGVAREKVDPEEVRRDTEARVGRFRRILQLMVEQGFIPLPPI